VFKWTINVILLEIIGKFLKIYYLGSLEHIKDVDLRFLAGPSW